VTSENNCYVCSNRIDFIGKISIDQSREIWRPPTKYRSERRIESHGLEPIKNYTQLTEIDVRFYVNVKGWLKLDLKMYDYFP
jgi:hypothetical protein